MPVRLGKQVSGPFARNWPFGCFAQMVLDTYRTLISRSLLRLGLFGEFGEIVDLVLPNAV